MYDPGIRRFTAIDPIRGTVLMPHTMVQYTYVLNNPLNMVDPWGLLGEPAFYDEWGYAWFFDNGWIPEWSLPTPEPPPCLRSILDEVWEFIGSMTDDELLFAIGSGFFEAMGVYIPSDWLDGLGSDGHFDFNEIRQDLVHWVVDAIIEDSSGLGIGLLDGWEFNVSDGWGQNSDSGTRGIIINLPSPGSVTPPGSAPRSSVQATGTMATVTGLRLPGDSALSLPAQIYIRHYETMWQRANTAYLLTQGSAGNSINHRIMEMAAHNAESIRELDAQGRVRGSYFSMPVFNQGGSNLCWAYSQAMMESFFANDNMTQAQASERASELAHQINPPTEENPRNWDRGAWPTNSPNVINQNVILQSANSFNTVARATRDMPVYAYFFDRGANYAHLTVITGTASAPGHVNLVASNNPWGMQHLQTWDEFLVMRNFNEDGSRHFDGTFDGILRVTPPGQAVSVGGEAHGS